MADVTVSLGGINNTQHLHNTIGIRNGDIKLAKPINGLKRIRKSHGIGSRIYSISIYGSNESSDKFPPHGSIAVSALIPVFALALTVIAFGICTAAAFTFLAAGR